MLGPSGQAELVAFFKGALNSISFGSLHTVISLLLQRLGNAERSRRPSDPYYLAVVLGKKATQCARLTGYIEGRNTGTGVSLSDRALLLLAGK